MAYYRVCEECGANLDPGETCDCKEKIKFSPKIQIRGIVEGNMTDMEVIESFNNAWRALARQYTKHPNEGIRCGMNLLAKIIGEVKSEVEESHREKQITIEEWIDMLQEGEIG